MAILVASWVMDRLPLFEADGSVNPHLMSYARLFRKEVVDYFRRKANPEFFQNFAQLIGHPEFAARAGENRECTERFVDFVLKSKQAFVVLDQMLEDESSTYSLYDNMHMSSAQDDQVVALFKQFFLRPAEPFDVPPKTTALDETIEEEAEEAADVGSESGESLHDAEEEQTDEGIVVDDAPVLDRFDTVLDKVAAAFDYNGAKKMIKAHFPTASDMHDVSDPLDTDPHAGVKDTRPLAALALRRLPLITMDKQDESRVLPPFIYNFLLCLKGNGRNRVALKYLVPDYLQKIEEQSARDNNARRLRIAEANKKERFLPLYERDGTTVNPQLMRNAGLFREEIVDYFMCKDSAFYIHFNDHCDSGTLAALSAKNNRDFTKSFVDFVLESPEAFEILDGLLKDESGTCSLYDKLHTAQNNLEAPPFRAPSEHQWDEHQELENGAAIPGGRYREPRDYQIELKQRASAGESTVIVAPTGSGKTNIAAEIILDHFMSRWEKGKESRVVFIVPKVLLAEQQANKFYGLLRNPEGIEFKVDMITGEIEFGLEPTRTQTFLHSNVLVMTPQVLINMLTSIRASERIFVSDISLLILDECHHTTAKHAYAELMDFISEWTRKTAAEGREQEDRLQIVGLTASLGVGKNGSNNVDNAMAHIYDLCARMGAVSLSTVREHKKNLADHVNIPQDEIRHLRRFEGGAAENPFTTRVLDYMERILRSMNVDLRKLCKRDNKLGVVLKEDDLFGALRDRNAFLVTERFNGRMETLAQDLHSLVDLEMKSSLMRGIRALKAYSACLSTNALLPASIALQELDNQMLEMEEADKLNPHIKFYKDNDVQTLAEVANKEDEKPMLTALRKEIKKQFQEDSASRVIIFVLTRELTTQVASYINSFEDLLPDRKQAGYVISSKCGNGRRTTAQAPTEQRDVLKKFRENQIPLIVATKVAEEGLDVPECNLIIKYNMTGNVISLKQQRGRARAQKSKHVLLVVDETVRARELQNHQAEQIMNWCLDAVHRMGYGAVQAEIKKAADRRLQKYLKEQQEDAERRDQMQKPYDIACGSCHARIVESAWMRRGHSHTVAVDPDVWTKTTCTAHEFKTRQIDDATMIAAKLECGSVNDAGRRCSHLLGKVIRYAACYFPVLDCHAIRLIDKDTNHFYEDAGTAKVRAWDDVSKNVFYIERMTDGDVEMMLSSLSSVHEDIHARLESNCIALAKKLAFYAEKRRAARGRKTGQDMEIMDYEWEY